MSNLALEMGCNLSSPRALLLIRERERGVNPQCGVSISFAHSLSLPIGLLEGLQPGVT